MFINFQAIDLNNILVLGNDQKLWLEYAPFTGTPPRSPIIVSGPQISAFQAPDPNHIFVLATNEILWLAQPPFGPELGNIVQLDYLVRSFQVLDVNNVLGRL